METLVVMLAGAGQTEAERISNLASKRWQRGCARDAFLLCQWLANANCSSKRQKRMRLERWKRLLVRSPRSPEHKRGGSSRVTLTGEAGAASKEKEAQTYCLAPIRPNLDGSPQGGHMEMSSRLPINGRGHARQDDTICDSVNGASHDWPHPRQ